MFAPLNITDGVYWVGALDKELKTFDIVMTTEYGTSYNSYVVKGSEKTAVIETAKDKFFDEFMERLTQVTDPAKLDYLIVNHTEPDHSGSVEKFLEINPDITVVGSVSAIKFLGEITNKKFNSIVVKEGDKLELGGKTLSFISAPFLHWPDSMYTYLEEYKILLPAIPSAAIMQMRESSMILLRMTLLMLINITLTALWVRLKSMF